MLEVGQLDIVVVSNLVDQLNEEYREEAVSTTPYMERTAYEENLPDDASRPFGRTLRPMIRRIESINYVTQRNTLKVEVIF